ncbi:Osmosensitive K+ channel histidine kinase KdpD [Euzebya pacifica]|uniref:histidine kinase n=2 Tax=Euzebya pacifica TaxID=1608957 RepID=A0A346Y0D6_9ACTN|nr:Osmosensitive K+ channel histidine kinase KdpD [Euzebya pacifica]
MTPLMNAVHQPVVLKPLLATLLVLAVLLGPACSSAPPDDLLTVAQRDWLATDGPIRVAAVSTIAPAAVVVDGVASGGWAVALTELMALKVGATVEMVVFADVDDAVQALEDGDVDAIAGLGARPDLVTFAEPIETLAYSPIAFAVGPEATDIVSAADLEGRTVTTIPGSVIEEQLLADHPELRYVPSSSIPDAVDAVHDGTVDLWAGPLALTTHVLRQQQRDTFRVVGEPISIAEVTTWGRSNSLPLEILAAGRTLLSRTEMSVIHVQWTGFDLTDPDQRELPPWLVPLLWAGLALLLAFAGGVALLRHQVRARTAQLAALNDELEGTVAHRTQALRDQSVELSEANANLLRSNDALARFARRVAHDIRGPLAAIKGFAQMAAREDISPSVRRTSLQTIQSSATTLADLVAEMLADARAVVPNAEAPIPLDELRTWLIDFTALQAGRVGGTVTLDSDHDLVDAPVATLKQLLVNLVGNALKHGGRHGIRVAVAMKRTESTSPWWTVTVDDDGQGIPEDQRELVFVSGYRTPTASEMGSGLGLAACREAVRGHGGTIVAARSPAGGTRIRFTLPVTEAPDEARPEDVAELDLG